MEKKRLKVLSYNIHKGFSSGNRKFILRDIRKAVSMVHPDIIFLQEVLGHHAQHGQNIKDWPTEPQFEFLANELWPHFAYGKNAVYSAGHHGNAILSKFPILKSENIDISTNRVEKRGLLHSAVQISKKRKPLHLICCHLGLLETERREQVRRLCRRIESHIPHGEPLLIGGDFNDWRGLASPVLKKTLGLDEVFQKLQGKHAKTFPSWLPALRLDRIYYRGPHAFYAKCLLGKPWSKLSDHIALYAELSI